LGRYEYDETSSVRVQVEEGKLEDGLSIVSYIQLVVIVVQLYIA